MRVRLVHWNETEAQERAERLGAVGYEVNWRLPAGPVFFRELADDPPDAIVIDLGRLPSQGRDFGVGLRVQGGTRKIPLVFVGGRPGKVAAVRALLPDATYTSWDAIAAGLAAVIADPPDDLVVPTSRMAGYAGKPLPEKLGVRAGMSVGLSDAPPDVAEILGELPVDVTLQGMPVESVDLILWFTRTTQDLVAGMPRMAQSAGSAPLWIVWPKRSSGVASDLTQDRVRQEGLAAGLVDYKICSVDETWSALLFTQRRE